MFNKIIVFSFILANAILCQNAIIVENFDHRFNHKWEAISGYDEDYYMSWQIESGKLRQNNIINDPTGLLRYAYLPDFKCSEFLAEVDIMTTNAGANPRIGFVFGVKGMKFYRFRICQDSKTNQTCADLWCNGWFTPAGSSYKWTKIIDAWISKNIEPHQLYRLRLIVTAKKWQFFLDESLVLEVDTDRCYPVGPVDGAGRGIGAFYNMVLQDAYEGGAVGLYAVETDALFDNLYLKCLNSNSSNVVRVQRYGKQLLAQDLAQLVWRHAYQANIWDCSNMSSCLGNYLRSLGWHVLIAQGTLLGRSHAWVLVETQYERYTAVEATSISIKPDFPTPEQVWNLDDVMQKYPWEYGYYHIAPPHLVKRS